MKDVILLVLVLLIVIQFGSIFIAVFRKDRAPHFPVDDARVTILRPLCGLENNLKQTLQSSFYIDYPDYEVLFCVASPSDPVIPLVEELIVSHPAANARLLIGEEKFSGNPKLNNLYAGWHAASSDWIVISDSNVLIPPSYIHDLRQCWSQDTAFVCSPPVGIDSGGVAGILEEAFLNTYQARWQMVADFLGTGYVQGKTILCSRSLTNSLGGLQALASEIAEDAAATKIARRNRKKVRVVGRPFFQPLGQRSFTAVWDRQLRWAELRRRSFPLPYSFEIIVGGLPAAFLYTVLASSGSAPWAGLPTLIGCWYAGEVFLAAAYGWPMSISRAGAAMLRDVLLPILWIQAWFANGFVWRGNRVSTKANPATARVRHT